MPRNASLTRTRRPVTNLLIAALSAVVVAAIGAFFFAPAQASIAADASTSRINTPTDVVYGTVTAAPGGHLTSSHAYVARKVGTRWVTVARWSASQNGNYRFVLKSCDCDLKVTLTASGFGVTRSVTRRINASPYHAYRISGQLTSHRSLFFLPIFSY